MASEIIKLFEADIDVDGIIKKSGELKQAMNDAKDAMVIAKLQTGETSKEYIIAEASVKKLSAEYRINQQQIMNLTADGGKMLTVQQKLTMSIDKEVKSIENAVDNNKELRKVRNSVNAETVEGQQAIADLNKKIDENTAYIKTNTDSYSKQKMEIGDYKTAIKDAYKEMEQEKKAMEESTKALVVLQEETEKGSDEWKYYNNQIQQNNTQINVLITSMGGVNDEMQATSTMSKLLSGDFKGLAQDSEKVGGAGNLVTSTLKGTAQSIWGVIKASLAFIATPIGLILTAVGLVLGAIINYLSSTQEGIDAVTSVTRPLIEVFKTLMSAAEDVGKILVKAFTDPIGAFKDLVGLTSGLSNELGEAWERGKRLDEVLKAIGNAQLMIASSESAFKDALLEQQQIYRDRSKTAAERMEASQAILDIEKAQSIQKQNLLRLEAEELKIKLATSDLDEDKLAYQVAINKLKDEERRTDELQVSMLSRINNIRNQGQKEIDDAERDRKAANDKAKEVFDQAIKQQEKELDLFIASQGVRAKTLQEELVIAEQVSKKKIDILNAELQAKKISQTEYDVELLKIQNDLLLKRSELAVDNAARELQEYISSHQSKLDADLFFSEESLKLEQERLNGLAEARREFAATQLDEGILTQQDYNLAINEINEENRVALEEAQLERDEAKKEQQVVDLENQRIIDDLLSQDKFARKQVQLNDLREAEIQAAEKTGADTTLIKQKYDEYDKQLDLQKGTAKLEIAANVFNGVADLLGKESDAGKAVALTGAMINVALGVTKAIAQGGLAGIATGALVAISGGVSIAKIATSKPPKTAKVNTPKAEHGMALDIGGKRHSSGGTKFYGEDGTNFEAEKGEKMFILNRQASAALGPLLSDINQQYGGISLSRPASYLAAGGQVIRGAQGGSSIDFKQMQDVIRESVMEGAAAGTRVGSREGSAAGTHSGMVDREDNIKIANGANF